ncbi:hypothetical protein NHX12_003829 [Muraenolepis orangiensis]|uniref:Uncharacterized protein n=1 Tax=Muraenolepis orangiensis TaxID=630683 RepID=A0A9Q0IBM6_9TELE|nr:hypothetical protein NHX12_003829 [Muraenolepis orangiensis]
MRRVVPYLFLKVHETKDPSVPGLLTPHAVTMFNSSALSVYVCSLRLCSSSPLLSVCPPPPHPPRCVPAAAAAALCRPTASASPSNRLSLAVLPPQPRRPTASAPPSCRLRHAAVPPQPLRRAVK